MVHVPLLLAFILAASLLTVTPGIDTAMVLRAATQGGRRPAVMAACGIALGCLVWGGAVAVGLAAMLRASALAYSVMKLAGAAYLVWLGCGLLFNPRSALPTDPARPDRSRHAFLRGLLTNLLNPKIGVFYVTFLPQFVPVGANVAATIFLLACLHVVLSLAWFAALIAATVPLTTFLRRPRAVTRLDRLTGCVFVGFGVKLATGSAR